MKKIFALLFVALLAMPAWADLTVTFIPGETVGENLSANAVDVMTLDGVTITCTSGAFATAQYRFGGGSTSTFSSTVGNIKKVEFTCVGSFGQTYGPDFYGDGYLAHSGSNVGVWQGDTATFTLKAASQVRCTKIVVTITEEMLDELVPPVFHPNGGDFTGSLEVTLTCQTENASIYYFEGTPEGSWDGFEYYNGPFYVTETKTYTAYSTKGGDISEYVTVTFTKVEPTVEAPVFTPAGGTFSDRIDVTLSCATAGATIYYSLDQELWNEYIDPIPVTDGITIWAKAVLAGVESETVSATYTKLPDTVVEVTFDGAVDKGNGDSSRHSYTVVKDPVTMYVGDGLVSTDHYRVYNSDSTAFTLTSAGAPILKIEINGQSGQYNPSNLSLPADQSGTYTPSATRGVWEGEAQVVNFKVNKQVRCYTIVVTLAGSEEPEYPLGDVNHDHEVTIADVSALIDYLLNDPTLAPAEANMNQDTEVSIADVSALIDYLLSN